MHGSLPEIMAIVFRNGWSFVPGNCIVIDGSGASIPSHPLVIRCCGHSSCLIFKGMLMQQLLIAIRSFFQDLTDLSLLGFESQSQISAMGRGPVRSMSSIEIDPSSPTHRNDRPSESGSW